jgi:hypothetical protein|tara:strand:+ start:734 stop:1921 length:1188 start_codon:yes stop_codon:yes gene_type:complete
MNIPIYDGNPLWNPNATAFGFYNNDVEFQVDCLKVAKFVTTRVGYPLMDVELQSGSIFTAFEEAITTYGNELYAYLIRENILDLTGLPYAELDLSETIVSPNFETIIRLSEQYGEEAGVGGNVPWYKGSIPLTSSVQDYDLKVWAKDQGITGSIEIKRVFFQEPVPASARYLDPFDGFGFGGVAAAGLLGLGGFGGSMGYLMMPLNYDMQVIQAIEMNEMVRLSNYSFEIHNNVIRIFPIPGPYEVSGVGDDVESGQCGNLWFEYIKRNDRISSSVQCAEGLISNVSNIPYRNPVYDLINSVGRQWIFEYTLALCKEILGYVRGKYSTVPIPNADMTLNQADLLAAATAEKTALLERLRAYFDETSRAKLLERKVLEQDAVLKELDQVPRVIYIG